MIDDLIKEKTQKLNDIAMRMTRFRMSDNLRQAIADEIKELSAGISNHFIAPELNVVINKDSAEYKKAYDIVSYFADEAKSRQCDGYLDLSKELICAMIDMMMPTFDNYGYGLVAYWSAVKYFVPFAITEFEASI